MEDGESTSHSRRRASEEEDLMIESRRSRSHRRRLSASSRNTQWNEQSSLLQESSGLQRDYSTVPSTPRPRLSRHHSTVNVEDTRPSRIPSFTQRLTRALSNYDLKNKTSESLLEERVWYDQVGVLLSLHGAPHARSGVLTQLGKIVHVDWCVLRLFSGW